jgi:RNA polymerase sigma factor (sigma-70 family)
MSYESKDKTGKYDLTKHIQPAKAGDQVAKAWIVEVMDGAVRTLALSFHATNPFLAVDDLVQEGRLRVLRAIAGWSDDRHTKFNTYAYRAVKNRFIEIAQRTKPLPQLTEATPRSANQPPTREKDTGGLESMIADTRDHKIALESFEGLGWDRSRVLLCRLGPVLEGREARPWRSVSKMENLPVKKCQSLYEEAVRMVKAAHGESCEGKD